jgi:SAM-dependent methyltransferase
MAAIAAQLSLADRDAPPEIRTALRAVSAAAGLDDMDDLAPPQKAMIAALVRMYLHQSLDLVEHPDREPGWVYTDPGILDGWGRGSAMVPARIAEAHPDLRAISSFLDVGTGVGLLAVAAAGVWPEARIVGIDPWEPALQRARENVTAADLTARITLRAQRLGDIDDVKVFDCIWIPGFFLAPSDLSTGVERAVAALRPGGWLVFGRFASADDPLTEATGVLRTIRAGGSMLSEDAAHALLREAGCEDVHTAPLPPPVRMEFVLGRRPADD